MLVITWGNLQGGNRALELKSNANVKLTQRIVSPDLTNEPIAKCLPLQLFFSRHSQFLTASLTTFAG